MKLSFASLTRFQLKRAANWQSRQLFIIHINPHSRIMINHSPLFRLKLCEIHILHLKIKPY